MNKEKASSDVFLCVLAHELKSPLNAVGGYLDMMSRSTLGNDISAYSEMISRSMLRLEAMKSMISEIMLLRLLDSGMRIGALSEMDIVDMASSVSSDFLPEATKRDIKINPVGENAPLMMKCYPSEVRIILSNLVSNAIKYNCEGGSVDINIEKTTDSVIINVADTGIGISPDDLKRLFNEFVRIKNEKTRKTEGSGLGLFIVKRLCGLYNGSVSVESTLGKGSVFTVCFPLQPVHKKD
ncbi:MAG: hypothetical protein A2020_02725 [Lentisphaerae bacterium GWF2_45_14]|nr:MAG: hypothetical protein A2020_02725 [Lentisphaerae bacterium GWF2_45_14]